LEGLAMPARQSSMRSDLQDVLITVARIDERMVTMFNRQEDIEQRVNSMDKKIQLISPTVKFGERVFWIMLVVVVGMFFNLQ
jgi:hypothetical protein